MGARRFTGLAWAAILTSASTAAAQVVVDVGTDVAEASECNLREAVACVMQPLSCAPAGCTAGLEIVIDAGVSAIVLEGALEIDFPPGGPDTLGISSADGAVISNAQSAERVIDIAFDLPSEEVLLHGVTIAGGSLPGAQDAGGAIRVISRVPEQLAAPFAPGLSLDAVTVTGGVARLGGAVFAGCGALALSLTGGSVLAGNGDGSTLGGGAVFVATGSGAVSIDGASVLSGNSAQFGGGLASLASDIRATLPALQVATATFSGNAGGGIFASLEAPSAEVSAVIDAACGEVATSTGPQTLRLESVEITNNSGGARGGGLFLGPGSAAKLERATLAANSATSGGGIFSEGTLVLVNVTVDGNSAANEGGGISSHGALAADFATISDNEAAQGGGIHVHDDALAATLSRSILLGNMAALGPACAGSLSSGGHNLLPALAPVGCGYLPAAGDVQTTFDASALLAPLSGGAGSATRALLFHASGTGLQQNAAVGAAGPCVGTDARGVTRGTLFGDCDIGAYESSVSLSIATAVSSSAPVAGGDGFTYAYTLSSVAESSGADGVSIIATLPQGVRFQGPASVPPSYTCLTPSPGSGGVITCGRSGTLPAGADETLSFSVFLAPDAALGPSSHTARVTSTLGDALPSDNAGSAAFSVAGVVALSLGKDDGLLVTEPGALITYELYAMNAGPSQARDATVLDMLQDNPDLNLIDWACVPSGGASCPASGFGDALGNMAVEVTLPPGGSVAISLRAWVGFSAGTHTLSNTATLAIAPPYTGVTSAAASDGDTVVSGPLPMSQLLAVKLASPSPVASGGVLSYGVLLINSGPDAVPPGLVFELGAMGSDATRMETFAASPGFQCSGVPPPDTVGAFSPICSSTTSLLPARAAVFNVGLRVAKDASDPIPHGPTHTTRPAGSGGSSTEAPGGATPVVPEGLAGDPPPSSDPQLEVPMSSPEVSTPEIEESASPDELSGATVRGGIFGCGSTPGSREGVWLAWTFALYLHSRRRRRAKNADNSAAQSSRSKPSSTRSV